jgi:hypothetical protein
MVGKENKIIKDLIEDAEDETYTWTFCWAV